MLEVLILYGSLAVLAALLTWHDEDLRWIGLWLVAGFLISNALYFEGVSPIKRTGPYSAIEIMIAAAAFWAIRDKSRWLLIILICNLISIAANLALLLNYPPSKSQVFMWNITTNLCFAIECLFAASVGLFDGYRTGNFNRLLPRRWRNAAPIVTQEGVES